MNKNWKTWWRTFACLLRRGYWSSLSNNKRTTLWHFHRTKSLSRATMGLLFFKYTFSLFFFFSSFRLVAWTSKRAEKNTTLRLFNCVFLSWLRYATSFSCQSNLHQRNGLFGTIYFKQRTSLLANPVTQEGSWHARLNEAPLSLLLALRLVSRLFTEKPIVVRLISGNYPI